MPCSSAMSRCNCFGNLAASRCKVCSSCNAAWNTGQSKKLKSTHASAKPLLQAHGGIKRNCRCSATLERPNCERTRRGKSSQYSCSRGGRGIAFNLDSSSKSFMAHSIFTCSCGRHAGSSPARRLNKFFNFRLAAKTRQEIVVSEQRNILAASAWLKPS